MRELILSWTRTIPYLNNQYVIALLIVLIAIVLARIFLFAFNKYLEHVVKKTKSEIDDRIFENIKHPLFYLILVYGLKVALSFLGIDGIVTKVINSLMAVVFLYILMRLLTIIIETWGDTFAKKTRTKIDEVLLPLFRKSVTVVFVIITLMWILNIWEIDITPYLAGVGIGGLVLGFALQDSLKNIFGGISIILDKNFGVGDAIRLESGELGVIKDIGLRSSKLLTYDNELIFVPNGILANSRIKNYVRPNKRVRKIVEFSVVYGSDVDQVRKIVLDCLKKIDDIYDDPYMDVIFTEMGDYGLHFQARFWAEWDNAYNKWLEATNQIYNALNKAGIEIPFPTSTVYLKK